MATNQDFRRLTSDRAPFEVVQGLLDPGTVSWLQGLADVAFRRHEATAGSNASFLAEVPVLPRGRFVVTASSFSLDAVLTDDDISRLREVFGAGVARTAVHLPPMPLALDVDQSWLRRQYPHADAPRFHSVHGWHQDGALGYDFSPTADSVDRTTGLLDMVTCWIALAPCGHDAPGLEVVDETLGELLPVDFLNDDEIRLRFDRGTFRQPILAAGDAMLFPGGTLHRTHLTEWMQHIRTSVELRLFDADRLPQRLLGDRFDPWLTS